MNANEALDKLWDSLHPEDHDNEVEQWFEIIRAELSELRKHTGLKIVDNMPEKILRIEKRWRDRLNDCETPASDGYEKIGYVCDIYDLLKHIRTMSSWQPIETCPKGGQWFLACGDYYSHAYLASFSVKHGITDYEGNKVEKTNYWMPLPKPQDEENKL